MCEDNQYDMEILGGQYFVYLRSGYDERLLEFCQDGTIGCGSAGCEARWRLNFESIGAPSLEILSEDGRLTCKLSGSALEGWHGNWLRFEQMPIKLTLISSNSWQIAVPHSNYKSQFSQDFWVLGITNGKRGGYFVEAGASDGIRHSNSYVLEKCFGWNGICVESTNAFKELVNNRTCICDPRCLGDHNGELMFYECVDLTLSSVTANRDKMTATKKECITLESLLSIYGSPEKIDYLSLDVEGYEYDILKTFCFNKYQFSAVTVEHNHNTNKRELVRALLLRNGYRLFRSQQVDDFFVFDSEF